MAHLQDTAQFFFGAISRAERLESMKRELL